jgi:hypothetical protein
MAYRFAQTAADAIANHSGTECARNGKADAGTRGAVPAQAKGDEQGSGNTDTGIVDGAELPIVEQPRGLGESAWGRVTGMRSGRLSRRRRSVYGGLWHAGGR